MVSENEKGFVLKLNLRTIFILVIFAFVFFTRLYNLQVKAMMHDEDMFAYYSWIFYDRGDFVYMPILHGPLLENMNALMFLLFGDSTYTTRLFPAICGILLFFVLFGFRRRFGDVGLVAALALCALSPFLMFYARFCRNDLPFAFFSLLVLYFYWKFFREGGGKNLVFAIICSMMLICIKENQMIFFFTIFTFAALLFVVDVVKGFAHAEHEQKKRHAPAANSLQRPSQGLDALHLICLLGGMASYMMGQFTKYYDLKVLGFGAILVYFALAFRKYYNIITHEEPRYAAQCPFFSARLLIPALALTYFYWILYVDLFSGLIKFEWGLEIIVPILISQYVLLTLLNVAIRRGWGEERLLRRFFILLGEYYWYLLSGLLISCIIYLCLFTGWFKHPESALSLYKRTFEYWGKQHKEQRISGPFHFYLTLLAIYELPALLIVIGGVLASLWKYKKVRRFVIPAYIVLWILIAMHFESNPLSADAWEKIDKTVHMKSIFHFFMFVTVGFFGTLLTVLHFWKRERFYALLVYWSMGSFLGYSYAGEKVPWVGVHIALPLLLLSAVYIQKLWQSDFFKKGAIARYSFYVVFVLFALWNLKSSIVVSFINHSNIAERMIYSHAPMDIPKIAAETKRIAFLLGTKEKTKILLKGDWPVWPMRWYLRHYDYIEYESPDTTNAPIVILDYALAEKSKNIKENYRVTKYKAIQWWVPSLLDFGRLFDIWKTLIPVQYTRDKPYGKDIKNSKEEWMKIWNYMLHRTPFEAHDSHWPSMSAMEIAFCVRNNVPY